jgi:hypothetical protein
VEQKDKRRWQRIADTMVYVDLSWHRLPRPFKFAIWLPVAYAAYRLGLTPSWLG